ncbi:extracellular solute-binding protein [Gorillibacterium massiliense]|uniref:extracellular solute-binding protein n=1 Tax=Gorillibacterium massiliense TaxID=1280390 RepID=UPI0004B4B929|nr:extracellular solute-binding protein [Gorillibacterium massiliense]
MKKLRKSVAASLALVLSMSALAACSKDKKDDASSTPAPASTTKSSTAPTNASGGADETGFKDGKYDPPITISSVKGVNINARYKKGETIEDNIESRTISKELGLDVKYDWTVTDTNDAYKTKLRLMLSSGDKMPDVVAWRGDDDTTNMLIDSGQFMSVNELFDKYAGDKYKAAVNVDSDMWMKVTRDGKKMALPITDYAYNDDMVLWLREDWMQKLNLQAPKTLADFENIMDAFVNKDPDGDGKKDTYGLALGFKTTFNNWMTDAAWLFGEFGTMPEQWNKLADGTLEYGSIDPGAKQAVSKLKDWMDKGYISKDAGLKDEIGGMELFTKGQAGAVVGRNWLPDWPLGDLTALNPNAKYKAYPIPVGPDGKIGTGSGAPPVNGFLFVNKNAKHPEAIIRYYNWLFDNISDPQVGSKYENGFAEGYDWAKLPDGTITKDPKAHPELFPNNVDEFLTDPATYSLTYDGARIPTQYADALTKLANGGTPETPYEKMAAGIRKKENIDAMKIVMDQKDIRMKNYFMGPLTDTMTSKNELLKKMVLETYNKVIYGQASIDEFDKMVENWKKSGGDTITKEVNDWYKSVQTK